MKRIAVSLLFFVIAVSLHAQVWTWQHPKPQGNNLNGVAFYDGSTGFAVGDNGTILKTVNGGITWTAQQSGTTSDLLTVCVSPTTALNAVAAGKNNTYLYTGDGGATWTPGNVAGRSNNFNWRGSFFYFVNNEVFLCGDSGYIVESVDNGATFATAVRTGSSGAYKSNRHRTDDALYSIAFYNSTMPSTGYGIVVGANSLVSVTSDGGNHWLDTTFTAGGFTLTGVAVPEHNYNDGSVVGYNSLGTGGIWHTTNNGYNWASSANYPNDTYLAVGLDENGDGPLFAISRQGQVATAGQSNSVWNADIYFNGNSTQLNAVSYPADNLVCIVGNAGKIFTKSTASSNQWVERDSGGTAGLHDISFVGTFAGYACGDGGAMVITTNGGVRWKDTQINGVDTLLSVSFADAKRGYTAGENGQIYYTANGGTTWTSQTSGVSVDITCIRAVDTLNAWACSVGGSVLYTTNAGGAWDSVTSPATASLSKIFFLNRNIGWVMAQKDSIYRTIDGGATWVRGEVTADPTVALTGIWFSDILHGWVTGSEGFVAQTSNGGTTWTQVSNFNPSLGGTTSVNAIGFIDAQNGWITCSGGSIYFSNDSGTTWHSQVSGTVNDLLGVDMVNIANGWTAGENGTILKLSNNNSSLAFNARVIDFGKVAFGLSKDTTVVLQNSGATTIPSNGSSVVRAFPIDQSGIDGQFSLDNPPGGVSPGDDTLHFSFHPQPTANAGQPRFRASVSDVSGLGGLNAPITLIGNGAYSSIAFVKGGTIDFSNVYIHHCSKVDSVEIQNTGEIAVTLSEIFGNVNGQPNTVFTVLDSNVTIPPGGTATIHLQFCPDSIGLDTGSVTFGGVPKPITIKLKGQGVRILLALSTKRIDIAFCGQKDTVIKVTNYGNTSYSFTNPIVRNPDGYLKLTNVQGVPNACYPGNTKLPGDSCSFAMNLAASRTAPPGTCDSTWLVFENPVGDPVDSIFISWCDISSNINDYDVSPLFSCIPVGTCQTRTVVLTNGGADLVLDTIKIEGLNASAYTWTPLNPPNLNLAFPYTILKGDSVTITWHFCPGVNDVGDQSNARIVTYYAPCGSGSTVVGDTNSDAFGACGILQGFAVNPTCIDFGETLQLGIETPKTLPDTLHFINAGSLPLTIYVKDLHPSALFSYSPADSFIVNPNGGTFDSFSTTFTPNSFGCYEDTVVFYSLQPAQSDTVCFHGCAFTKGLNWYPATLTDLGTVLVSDSNCITGYITNTGSTPDTLTSITGTSATFTANFPGTFPIYIQPGDTLHIIFCYHPQQVGSDAGQITFVAQSGTSPVFNFKGTGYSIGQTCVALVPPPKIGTQQLGTPVAVAIRLLNAVNSSPTYSFRATVKYDPNRLLIQGVQPGSCNSGWSETSSSGGNGEYTFTLSGATPLQGTCDIADVIFKPYYGSALSTMVMFDTTVMGGFKFNIQPGQDSTNPVITCALDTAVLTYDSICGLTISNIVFQQGTFLYQNNPNPIAAVTGTIQFQTGEDGNVQLLLFNQFGIQVQQLVNANLKAGFHSVDVDTRALPAGSYFYELIAPDKTIIRRMVVIK